MSDTDTQADPFVRRLVRRLANDDGEALRLALIDASELARIWKRFAGDPARVRSVVGPFSDTAPFPHMTSCDADVLLQALIAAIERPIARDLIAAAAHGVTAFAAPAARPALIAALRRAPDDDRARFQILLALEALGEDIFSPSLSRSAEEHDDHRQIAQRFLHRLDTM